MRAAAVMQIAAPGVNRGWGMGNRVVQGAVRTWVALVVQDIGGALTVRSAP